jgi:hypothetical protein
MYFQANANPTQVITDLSSYVFEIPQGLNSTYILPVGIFVDPDGDNIQYTLCFFENYASLSTVTWATFYPGIEGVSYIEFTEPDTTTHSGFNLMLSDGISSSQGPISIGFTINKSPVLSSNPVNLNVYPNQTFTLDIELLAGQPDGGYFSDPEGQPLTFTSSEIPSEVSVTPLTSSKFQITADFSSTYPTSPLSLTFTASDGASKSTNLQVTLLPNACAFECSTCFGPSSSE